MSSPAEESRQLVALGAELAGAAAGGAIGLVGGPPGAIGGAVAGVAITRALQRASSELMSRLLGPRQQVRVGAAFAIAASDIRTRLEEGEVPRQDWFESDGGYRPAAEEVLEGTLLAAADSFEERKVPYLGYLYASIAFDTTLDSATAHYLIRTASALTYRQLVAIAFYARPPEDVVERWPARVRPPEPGLIVELDDLAQRLIIERHEAGGADILPFIRGNSTPVNSRPDEVGLTTQGQQLYSLMDLRRVPEAELYELASGLGVSLDA